MRVSWITFGSVVRGPDGEVTSDVASVRYRVLSPIRELQRPSFQHVLTAIRADTAERVKSEALDADVVVFSKSFLASNETLAERAIAQGTRVIFDVCDDHYQHPDHGAHFRRMSALAHQLVCNTPQMARAARPYCEAEPLVIADPYEGPRGDPAFSPSDRLRLLWFGHPSNLDSLGSAMGDLAAYAANQPLALTVLTQLTDEIEAGCRDLTARSAGRLSVSAKPWSLAAQWRELADCDVVIIPSRDTPERRVKSANRMIESLRAGRPVVAQALPAYEPFARWAPATASLAEGCRRLQSEPSAVEGLISQAQAYIEQTFAPAAVAARWAEALETQSAERLVAR